MTNKYIKILNFILLGLVTTVGLAGNADMAIAGIAIYLIGKELP